MYMTAPMGVMQQVQAPLAQAPSFVPQVAPAAQRILASAVSSTTPVPVTNPDRKQAPSVASAPRPQLAVASAAPVTPERMAWEESNRTVQTIVSSLNPAKPPPLNLPDNAGFAAQLLAQEDMAEITLPQTPNIADMLKRVAERKSPQPHTLETPVRTPSPPSGPMPIAPQPAALNAVMRRDTQGAVLVPRGIAAYAQAQWRIQRAEAAAHAPDEQLEAV